MPSVLPKYLGDSSPYTLTRLRRLLILFAVGIIVLTFAATGRSIWRDYHARLDNTRQQLTAYLQSFERHVARTFADAQTAIGEINQDSELMACLDRNDPSCLQGRLARLIARHPQIASAHLLSRDGRLLGSTLPTPDESTPRFLLDTLGQANLQTLEIGAPATDPKTRQSLIPLRQQGAAGNGKPGFSILLALNAESLLAPSLLEHSGSFMGRLYLDEQTLLVSSSAPPPRPDNDLTVLGLLSQKLFPSQLSIRQLLTDWPLSVEIARHESDITDGWLQESLLLLAVAGACSLGGSLLLWYMLRLIRTREKAEDALYLSSVAIEMGADMAIWVDHHACIRYANVTACQRLGYSEKTLLSMRLPDICPGLDMSHWPRFWHKLKKHKHLYDEQVLRARSGEEFPAENHSSFVVFKGQEYNCAVVRDISERKQAEKAILRREQELRLALEAANTGLFDMPLDGRHPAITSPEYDRLLGFEPGTLTETLDTWKEQLHPADRDLAQEAYQDYYLGKSPQFIVEYRRRVRTGDYRWFQVRAKFTGLDHDERPTRLIGTLTDITERKLAEYRIAELANLDAITGLANRNLLRDELQAAVGSASRRKRRLAVLFLDLDRFKTINDSLGHAAGDAVLAQVAGRLRQSVDKTDILARLGGDEFVVVLTDIGSPMDAGLVAERLLASFAEPFRLEAGKFATTTSIGISVFPDDTRTPDALIRNADVAMYQAKAAGRNNYQFFTADMNIRATERLALETGLRQSLANHEFELLFQPQADLCTGHVIGAEALLRWRHPERGIISPSKFIPVAEESHMIVPIGNWVLNEACRQAANWVTAGLPPITVAVNLSPLQLHQANLLDLVQQALTDSGLPAQYLELEVTESVLMQEVEHVMSMLAGLKQMGVRLSIDDFGTGYSSLSYLKRFDFDKLKIDQSFVHDVLSDPNDAAIVRAIIGLGKTLGMSVLAEGVETFEQLDFLHRSGADAMQGYYFSPALTHEDFVEVLQERPMLNLPLSEIGM